MHSPAESARANASEGSVHASSSHNAPVVSNPQCLQWETACINGKYYLAQPAEMERLHILEAQIREQKAKLNVANANKTQVLGQSKIEQSGPGAVSWQGRPESGISRDCKTEINELKELKARFRIENQLVEEEQKNKKRFDEAKKKKNSVQNQMALRQPDKQAEKDLVRSNKQGFQAGFVIPKDLMSQSRASQKMRQKQSNNNGLEEQYRSNSKNFISFQPDQVSDSPRFEQKSRKSIPPLGHQTQVARRQHQKQSASNVSHSPALKSFTINSRKSPFSSKQKQDMKNNRRQMKSPSSVTSRVQIQALSKKIKQMQEKLDQVQQKQKAVLQKQGSKTLANKKEELIAKIEYNEPQQEEITRKPSIEQAKVELDPIETQTQQPSKQIRRPGRVQRQNLSSGASGQQQLLYQFQVKQKRRLNLARETVAYNYTDDMIKARKAKQEAEEKQSLIEQMRQLKKVIRQLQMEKIRHEAYVNQIEKKEKNKQSLNALLHSKLEHRTTEFPKMAPRLATEKRQKTEENEESSIGQQIRASRIKESSLSRLKVQLKKIDSSEMPIPKKPKINPLKIDTNTIRASAFQEPYKRQLVSTVKQFRNETPNPEEYKQYHPYSLSKKGIVARTVVSTETQEKQGNSKTKEFPSRGGKNYEPNSPTHTGRKIFQLQFVKEDKKGKQFPEEPIQVQVPDITISGFKIPPIPETPNPDISQSKLLVLAKELCDNLGINLDSDDHLYMKKYKNCIIFKTPDPKKTVVWHYSGKLYVGGWDQYEFGEGKKNGYGFQFVPDKHCYQGQFLDGKKNGSGTMMLANGNIYKGQWMGGQRHGQGTYYDKANDSYYEGEWKQDKKQGKGILKISGKQFYDGTFMKSIKHGYGIECFSNGDYYKGEYKIGRFHGKGRYIWADGASYDGTFVEGKRQGYGKWKSSKQNYDSYVGEYKNDKKSGKGEYTWSNGTVYEGYFESDVKHGEGRVEYPDGREVKGYWEAGKLVEIDTNMEESEESIRRSTPFDKPQVLKIMEKHSKELQPSKLLVPL